MRINLVLTAALSSLVSATALGAPDGGAATTPSIDLGGMDRTVKPGDDFFRYANGAWERSTEIPADRPRWGVFSAIAAQADERVRELLEAATKAPAGTEARKAGDYYATFLDEATIEARGVTPLAPALERIEKLADKKALAKLLGQELRADVDPLNSTNFATDRLFGLWVSPALDAPQRYTAYLLQGGLGLPDRDYYLDESPRMKELRTTYEEHIALVLHLAGVADEKAKAARVLALETKMAQGHASREVSADVLKANNPWKRADFGTKAPGLDWGAFFDGAGLSQQQRFIVWHPKATTALSALVQSEPLSTWKEWLVFHTIDRASPALPKAFVDASFDLYGRALSGTPELRARWKRSVSRTNEALGDAVGHLWVARYFPAESKARIQVMVKNLVAAFQARIDALEWMAPKTKAQAKQKLATLYVGIGYPEKWVSYEGLVVTPGDALGNLERAGLFEYRRQVAKLGKPVDRMEWCMTPQTVNAVNLPVQNALNFPAAILQPPFFDPAATAAANYGSLGATIGHEISHSFDDQGALFDSSGRLANWWTKEDAAHFEASGAQLVAQYNAYEPFPDLHVNGKLTLSENIADLAGLAATHDAWVHSRGAEPALAEQGFTPEQQFFVAYAQSWREKSREKSLRQQIIVDGHAPDPYRAATVRNVDAWYTAFDVKPGEKLFLEPKERVRVW